MACLSGYWLGVATVALLLTVAPGIGFWILVYTEIFAPMPPR
jgi:predicted PurR-regulated permease PerM